MIDRHHGYLKNLALALSGRLDAQFTAVAVDVDADGGPQAGLRWSLRWLACTAVISKAYQDSGGPKDQVAQPGAARVDAIIANAERRAVAPRNVEAASIQVLAVCACGHDHQLVTLMCWHLNWR